ncbi:MAG TPA: hypothetical protein VGH97_13060 [Thermoanaerobaculia bacterium]|jgi:hypothetical protein
MRRPGAAACALALGLFVAAGTAAVVRAEGTPAKTPTPRPRLSGGFGRPRNTPVPAEDAEQAPADPVRAARETREQNENPSREKSAITIDNHSLVTNPDKGRVSTAKASPHAAGKARGAPGPTDAGSPAAPPAPPSAPSPEPVTEVAPPPTGIPAAPAADEAQWRAAAQAARKRVADGKAHVAELTAGTKKLENDFYAWDDGQYRDRVIKPAWDKMRDQLEDAKRDLLAAEQELADLPEKARRAGALPGWIRE